MNTTEDPRYGVIVASIATIVRIARVLAIPDSMVNNPPLLESEIVARVTRLQIDLARAQSLVERLMAVAMDLDMLWAAIGDRLLAKGPLSRERVEELHKSISASLAAARAAVAEE